MFSFELLKRCHQNNGTMQNPLMILKTDVFPSFSINCCVFLLGEASVLFLFPPLVCVFVPAVPCLLIWELTHFLTSVCLDRHMFCKQDGCGKVFHMSNSSVSAQLELRSHLHITRMTKTHTIIYSRTFQTGVRGPPGVARRGSPRKMMKVHGVDLCIPLDLL